MFEKNDVVCFLGDSITTNGCYIKELFQYLSEEHKEEKVKLFNCGVPGDAANRCLKRVYNDCLALNPNKVIVMFGVNDVERELYKLDKEIENREERKEQALKLYKESMEELIDIIIEYNAQPILCTTTPSDDLHLCNNNVNEGLEKCRDFIFELANRKNLKVINFYDNMLPLLNENIINDDGVHPSNYGHHCMAQIVLKELGYIDEVDNKKIPSISEINELRYNNEQEYRNIKFVEWCALYEFNREFSQATIEEKKNECKRKAQNCDQQWFTDALVRYINNVDRGEKIMDNVIKYTGKMYK